MTLDITYSTVRLILRHDKTALGVGSGFLYRRDGHYFLVTAWHNLTGRHSETLKPIHSQGGLPNNLIADMPQVFQQVSGERSYLRMPVRFDFDDKSETTYLVHRQPWPRVDVAVLPFDPRVDLVHEFYLSTGETCEAEMPLIFEQPDGSQMSIVAFTDFPTSVSLPADFITSDQIVHTVGDDLFLLGFPAGIMDQSVTPIWKRATIATEDPSNGWNRQKQFLVDSASRKGMSGGPALYFSKRGHVPVEPGSSISIGQPFHILHGVYVGRLGDSEFEAQVGVVWKKEAIDEIIDNGIAGISTWGIECNFDQIEATVAAEYPAGADHSIYLENKPGLYYFTYNVMEKLGGRCAPEVVQMKIKELAARKMLHNNSIDDNQSE